MKLRRFAGVSEAGARSRNPERSEGSLVPYPIHKRPQLSRPGRMPQLPQRFGFDLADAFAGDRERLPDFFFQSVLAAVFEAEAQLDDFFFARGQRAQDLSSLVLQVHVDHRLGG